MSSPFLVAYEKHQSVVSIGHPIKRPVTSAFISVYLFLRR